MERQSLVLCAAASQPRAVFVEFSRDDYIRTNSAMRTKSDTVDDMDYHDGSR